MDIGLQQRKPHLPKPLVDQGFGQMALAAESAKDPLDSLAELLEHGPPASEVSEETKDFRVIEGCVSTPPGGGLRPRKGAVPSSLSWSSGNAGWRSRSGFPGGLIRRSPGHNLSER